MVCCLLNVISRVGDYCAVNYDVKLWLSYEGIVS